MLKKCIASTLKVINSQLFSNIITKENTKITKTDEEILKQKYESYSPNLVIRPAKGFAWGAGSKAIINSDTGTIVNRIFY